MLRIVTTYVTVVLMLSLGFFGVGTLASAEQFGAPAATVAPVAEPGRDTISGR